MNSGRLIIRFGVEGCRQRKRAKEQQAAGESSGASKGTDGNSASKLYRQRRCPALEYKHRAKRLLQRLALGEVWPPAAGQRHGPPGVAGQLPAARRRLQVALCVGECPRRQRQRCRAPAAVAAARGGWAGRRAREAGAYTGMAPALAACSGGRRQVCPGPGNAGQRHQQPQALTCPALPLLPPRASLLCTPFPACWAQTAFMGSELLTGCCPLMHHAAAMHSAHPSQPPCPHLVRLGVGALCKRSRGAADAGLPRTLLPRRRLAPQLLRPAAVAAHVPMRAGSRAELDASMAMDWRGARLASLCSCCSPASPQSRRAHAPQQRAREPHLRASLRMIESALASRYCSTLRSISATSTPSARLKTAAARGAGVAVA